MFEGHGEEKTPHVKTDLPKDSHLESYYQTQYVHIYTIINIKSSITKVNDYYIMEILFLELAEVTAKWPIARKLRTLKDISFIVPSDH